MKIKVRTEANERLLRNMLNNMYEGTITFVIQDGYIMHVLRNERYRADVYWQDQGERM